MNTEHNGGQTDGCALSGDALRAWVLRQTARVRWIELQRAFARGLVIRVDPRLDLVETACLVVEDRKGDISGLLDESQICRAGDRHARDWLARNPQLWAVVVPPWVLVQERDQVDCNGVGR